MRKKWQENRRVDTFRIHNSRPVLISLAIEPWGEVHSMEAGEVLEIVARGPAEGSLEFEITQEGFILFGWPGSVVKVLRDGKEITKASGSLPVPAPPGRSVRDFVGWMNQKTKGK